MFPRLLRLARGVGPGERHDRQLDCLQALANIWIVLRCKAALIGLVGRAHAPVTLICLLTLPVKHIAYSDGLILDHCLRPWAAA